MRKMLFFTFITINLLFILLEQAYSSDWKYMGTSKQGDFYLDYDSVKYNDSLTTFWYMYVNKKGEVNKVRCSIDCKKRAIAFIEHWESRPDLPVVKVYPELNWIRIPPGSAWDRFHKSLCKNR